MKLVCVVSMLLGWSVFAAPTISDVKVTPVAPWGMAIDYTVNGAEAGDGDVTVRITATGSGKTYTAKNLTGDTRCVNGGHRVMWNMAKDGVTATVANSTVSVQCCWPKYCVIDLSAGASAKNYPVTYLEAEPTDGFNVTDYKTTKLVLKRIPSGMFIMGENQGDESHRITLTKPFYMGLFEMTQTQWQLVMGTNPSANEGDTCPVENVSYDMIRGSSEGAKWPASNAVDALSFLGKLRARTGLDFDLPTDAQWEYVCRAGTTTVFSYGDSENGDYMWYRANAAKVSSWSISGHARGVGTKKPNPWGFYDMHGNVWEWCLDWRNGSLTYGTDPKGPSSGTSRALRGGGWICVAAYCTSACQSGDSRQDATFGFRLALTLP